VGNYSPYHLHFHCCCPIRLNFRSGLVRGLVRPLRSGGVGTFLENLRIVLFEVGRVVGEGTGRLRRRSQPLARRKADAHSKGRRRYFLSDSEARQKLGPGNRLRPKLEKFKI
jgi:hypothetical protein